MRAFVIIREGVHSTSANEYSLANSPYSPSLKQERDANRSLSRTKSEIPTKAGRRGQSTTLRDRRLIEGMSSETNDGLFSFDTLHLSSYIHERNHFTFESQEVQGSNNSKLWRTI